MRGVGARGLASSQVSDWFGNNTNSVLVPSRHLSVPPPPADYPQVRSSATYTDSSAATSRDITLPATVSSGDLLLMIVGAYSNYVPTTPSGWTQIDSTRYVSTWITSIVYAKVAAGTEGGGTATLAMDGSTRASAVTFAISDWAGSLSDVYQSYIGDSIQNLDPASLSPTPGSSNYLWLVGLTWKDGSTYSVSLVPTGYGNDVTAESGVTTEGAVYVVRKEATASSDNPSTFEMLGGSTQQAAWTIAVNGL